MAFSNFSIRPTSSTLTASGSGLNFNAPALPNLEALFNRFSPQNDDWKLKYQADLAAYDKNYQPPKDEHQRMMEKLQEREALGKLQAMEQGPVKRMTTFGGGAINGWVTDPNNMNAWQRQMYLPNESRSAPDYSDPEVKKAMAAKSQQAPGSGPGPYDAPAPAEPSTTRNDRNLNNAAVSNYLAAGGGFGSPTLSTEDQIKVLLQQIAELQAAGQRRG